MNWKIKLRILERAKEWDEAIAFMQKVIEDNPDDMDGYIFMNYLLMNLLAEEDYDVSKKIDYCELTKKYFKKSYSKFFSNPEYLYLTGRTAIMGEWFFGIDEHDRDSMLERAMQLDPNNLVYKETYYWSLETKDPKNRELIAYAKLVLSENSPIEQQLKDKGSIGEYLLRIKRSSAKGILWRAEHSNDGSTVR